MKILVTGGMGFVGHHLVKLLLGQKHEVVVLGRSSKAPHDRMLPGLTYQSCDLSKGGLESKWFDGVEGVFHVAAKAGIGGSYREYQLTNFHATQNLLEKCLESEVKLFIHTSTPSVVFSTRPICGGNESLPYSKENFSPYASTKALAEKAVLAANNFEGMRTLALRPHLVWGSEDPHLLPRVVTRHRAGKLRIVGNGKNLVDLTHVENVAHAHLCALNAMRSDPFLGGKPYFIGQNEPVSLWDWLNLLFSKLDLPPLKKSISYQTAYSLGRLMEWTWKLLPLSCDPPMTRFVACQLAHDHWFCGSAAEKDLGYHPVLTMEEALVKTLPWLRNL